MVYTERTITRAADAGINVGDRVAIHPGTDNWLMGERFGAVVRIGRRFIYVKLDLSRREIPFYPGDLAVIP